MITPLDQEKLVSCAIRRLLPPGEDPSLEHLIRCGLIGAGVGVAASWLDGDREYSAQEVAGVVFPQIYETITGMYGVESVPDGAGHYFLAGFNWLLRSWVPVSETIAH